MRVFSILILLLMNWHLLAQNDEILNNYLDDVCECMTTTSVDEITNDTLLEYLECFHTPESDEEIEAIFGINIDSLAAANKDKNPYDLGYEQGDRMYTKIQPSLVRKCDAYYEMMKRSQKFMLDKLSESYDETSLDSISRLISLNPNSVRLITLRGAMLLGKKEYDLSILDMEKGLDDYRMRPVALFYIGWAYEQAGEYEFALEYFDQLVQETANGNLRRIGFTDIAAVKAAIIRREQN